MAETKALPQQSMPWQTLLWRPGAGALRRAGIASAWGRSHRSGIGRAALAGFLVLSLAGCETLDSVGEQVGGWFDLDAPSPVPPASGSGSRSSTWPPPIGGSSTPAADPAPAAGQTAAGQPAQGQTAAGGQPGPVMMPLPPLGASPAPAQGAGMQQEALPPVGQPSVRSPQSAEALPPAIASWSGLQQDLAKSSGDRIFFAAGATELTPRAQEILVWQAGWLRRNPDVAVTLVGHADDKGSADQNLLLGQRRAEAAKKYLVALGISASRIETVSFGNRRPFATGTDAPAKALNRRVVTVVNPN